MAQHDIIDHNDDVETIKKKERMKDLCLNL